jgi:hypothetical protein
MKSGRCQVLFRGSTTVSGTFTGYAVLALAEFGFDVAGGRAFWADRDSPYLGWRAG